MEDQIIQIQQLFKSIHPTDWDSIHKIPQSGGDRVYFRIHQGSQTWIATYSLNMKENQTFIYFANHFKDKGYILTNLVRETSETLVIDVSVKETKTGQVMWNGRGWSKKTTNNI